MNAQKTDVIEVKAWPGEMPEISDGEISASCTADVVIIGGGHAGLACALGAAEKGAKVAVIEKRPKEKMTWMGEQIGAFNSRFCTERGYGGCDLEEVVDAVCQVYNNFVNRALVKKYVYHSGRVLDHYLSFIPEGSTILDDDQFNIQRGPEGTVYPIVRGGVKTWAGTVQFRGEPVREKGLNIRVNERSRLPELLHWVLDETVRLGVDWRYSHQAVVLTKENGRVTGVIARDGGGNYVRFTAKKGVLIALGSFTDYGNKLGVWAGGHMDNCPFEPMPSLAGFRVPYFCFGNSGFINLNNNGKRFHNEIAAFSTALQRQPDGIISFVTDANWLEQVRQSTLLHGNADFGRPEYFRQAAEDLKEAYDLADRSRGAQVRNLGLSERETSVLYAADTLDELAGYLGYQGESRENFLKSIARYNELCHKGFDEDWGKEKACMLPIETPPFYGGASILEKRSFKRDYKPGGQFSGLETDDNFNVVDGTCNPIPGLYAAGDCLGNYRSVLYYTPCGGNHIGSAMTHGYLIGEALGEA